MSKHGGYAARRPPTFATACCIMVALLLVACCSVSAQDVPPHASSEAERGASSRSGSSFAAEQQRQTPPSSASDQQKKDMGSFFRQVDSDDDGQIETHELSKYLGQSVGGHELDTEREIRDAVAGVTKALDSHDVGSTISEEELVSHLTKNTNQLLTTHRVERWVRYGLGFPQYAERFAANAITALDFAALIADDGQALREDLGVTSGLHHGKLMRALKRQILGLGLSPSEPRDVHAEAINATAIAVQWAPPDVVGVPPVHAYVVQVREGSDPQWKTVGQVTADEISFVSGVQPRTVGNGGKGGGGVKESLTVPYRYRVVAWGAPGSSGYSDESPVVEMRPVKKSNVGSGGGGGGKKRKNKEQEQDDDNVEDDDEDDGGGLYSMLASTVLAAGLVTRFALSSASFIGGPGTVRSILWKGITLTFNNLRGRGKQEVSGGGNGGGSGGGGEEEEGSFSRGNTGGGAKGADRDAWERRVDADRGGHATGAGARADAAREVSTAGPASAAAVNGGGAGAWDGDSVTAGGAGSPAPPTGAGRTPLSPAPAGLRRVGSRDDVMPSGAGVGGDAAGGGGGRPPLHRSTSKRLIDDAMAAAAAAGVAGDCSAAERSLARERTSRGTSFASLTSNGSGSSLDEHGGGGFDRGGDAASASLHGHLGGNGNGLSGAGSGGAAAAAAAGGGGGGSGVGGGDAYVGAAAGGATAVVGSEAKKKGRCCAIGCEARWDRWTSMGDVRMKYTKHYCGLCQRAYCQAHTRVSPHGAKGRCDPESKCYCATCHATLDRATQEALEVTNKLPVPKAPGPPGEGTPSKKAKSLWRSITNYKLRTASSANLASLSPNNSMGNLAAAGGGGGSPVSGRS